MSDWVVPYVEDAFDDVWMLTESQGWYSFLLSLKVGPRAIKSSIFDALYVGRDWIQGENLPEAEEHEMLRDMIKVAVFAIEDYTTDLRIDMKQGVADFKRALQADGLL